MMVIYKYKKIYMNMKLSIMCYILIKDYNISSHKYLQARNPPFPNQKLSTLKLSNFDWSLKSFIICLAVISQSDIYDVMSSPVLPFATRNTNISLLGTGHLSIYCVSRLDITSIASDGLLSLIAPSLLTQYTGKHPGGYFDETFCKRAMSQLTQ